MKEQADFIPPSAELLEMFHRELTPELYARLRLDAHERCKGLTWHGVLGGPARGGAQSDDFVHDAIKLFLEGKRIWKPDACSLKQFLQGVIRSMIGHSAKSEVDPGIRARS